MIKITQHPREFWSPS